ncbi:DNA-binding protein [Pseudomonas sp. R5(2019)]|uniref:DNA-binding protein n=1 Tax=Pseudomonas sp. R5(2019) TaxID=2697566 RepID=UPI0014130FF3|nr:DNA-binding protein [Pseudomonas sp. R5(2019)]NBA93481.1 integrase [Pseudomonas sp. R5(2019)]
MARGGINKAVVQKARQALLARGEHPSIDAVRIEMGNTGSKTTIHRYLKELEDGAQPRDLQAPDLGDELAQLVAGLAQRLKEEAIAPLEQAHDEFAEKQATWQAELSASREALAQLQQQHASQRQALEQTSAALSTSQGNLHAEEARNARLSQTCDDQQLRLEEKAEHIRSLEDKHQHARDALEHYRNAIKEQREQEQRRHEGQLQQLQMEVRQLQQTLIVKQDELTRLNRDNERLLVEARQARQEHDHQRRATEQSSAEVDGLKTLVAQAEGGRQALSGQIEELKKEMAQLAKVALRRVHKRRVPEAPEAE